MMQAKAEEDRLIDEFEALRPYLLRVAYSHLGSLSEAEDIVQESWVRLQGVERSAIRNLRAWLTTVVSRLALDALTSARARRERYVGPWLPEPIVEHQRARGRPGRPRRPRRVGEHGHADRARIALTCGTERVSAP